MKYTPRQFTTALVLVAALILGGCGAPVNRSVGDGIKAALPGVVGTADSWDVDVTGNPGTIIGGHIPGVIVHGVNVHVSPQMTMAHLDITATDVYVDVRKRELKRIGSLTFAGVLTQEELDSYLRATAPTSKGRPDDFKITLNDHDLSLSFSQKIASFHIPVKVAGRLNVSRHGDDKIDFMPSKLAIASVPIPKKLIDYAADAINPAIDLSSLSFPVHLDNIHVSGQRVMFSGGAEIPKSAFEAAQQQVSNVR